MDTSIPTKRVKDIKAARSIHEDLKERDKTASATRAQVRNQIEGGLPVSPSKLKKLGRSNDANANHGTARADFERAAAPYFRLIFDMPKKAAITIHAAPGTPSLEVHQSAAESAFDRFFTDWGSDAIISHLSLQCDHVGFGVGIAYFDRPDSPRWTCVSRGSIRVPRKASVSSRRVPLVELDESFSVSDLYEKIEDEDAARLAGWNVGAVKRLIARILEHGGDSNTTTGTSKWEDIQDRIRDNDIGCSVTSDTIACVTHLVLEKNGKVSKRIFQENPARNIKGEIDDDAYLFEKTDFADSMNEVIQFIVFEVPLGERNFHGIKGQAIKNYPHARIDNKFRNKLLNAVDAATGMHFLNKSSDLKAYPVAKFGDTINVYNQGLEQIPFSPNLAPAITLLGVFEQNRAATGAQYSQASAQIAQSQTARQASILAGMESQMDQASAALYLAQMSGVFAEQVRRLRAKGSEDVDAKAFQKRLKETGMPDESIFNTEWTVTTSASPGGATPWSRDDSIQRWLQLIGHPMVNPRFILEMAAAKDFGPNGVAKAVVPDADPTQQDQARDAVMENLAFGQGQPIEALQHDMHEVHIAKHMEPLAALVTQFQQSGQSQPRQAMVAATLSQHIQQHFDFLAQNKNAKPIRDRLWNPFQAMNARVENMIKSAQQQQQPLDVV